MKVPPTSTSVTLLIDFSDLVSIGFPELLDWNVVELSHQRLPFLSLGILVSYGEVHRIGRLSLVSLVAITCVLKRYRLMLLLWRLSLHHTHLAAVTTLVHHWRIEPLPVVLV